MRLHLVMVVAMLSVAGSLFADTLHVGPGKRFAKPSEAIKSAKDGDVIEIDVKGNYDGDVAFVRANDLAIRGVGGEPGQRAVLDAKGTVAGRKGIFVTQGRNTVIENIEFRNAGGEVNAAGIRAEGENLTVRNCKFYECRDGILGGAGEVLIEHSVFSHCGHNANPATHSVYINQRVTKLTFRHNYSTHTHEGHLFKSRARENWVLYNRLTDEAGQGSAVLDLPEGGLAVVVGNIMHKGPNGKNNRMIAYGMEGLGRHSRNELYVVNNTMWWDNRRPGEAWFVRLENKPRAGVATQPDAYDYAAVIRNNLCIGPLKLTNRDNVVAEGNVIVKTIAEARLVDAAKYDFALTGDSPAVGKAATPGSVAAGPLGQIGPQGQKHGTFDLTPRLEYVHPAGKRDRPADAKLDAGALEFVPGPVTR